MLQPSGMLQIDGASLEYRHWGPQPMDAPTIVLLHEGLGCVGLWGYFPARLAEATGIGVFAWSRAGYGASSTVMLPRPLDYMEREAHGFLPKVLDAIGLKRGVLVGHSDGASIAAIHAGEVRDPRISGICLIAPHFIVEEASVASIAKAKDAYERGELRAKLARWHRDVDAAFHGWNGAWLDPAFRDWDISGCLNGVVVPALVIQGEIDQYGTIRQIEIMRERCGNPVEIALLPGVGHSPHREAADITLGLVRRFASSVLAG